MDNIKNIIFDLGGVIMEIDVKQTMKAFSGLGIQNIEQYFGHGFAASFFSDHEAGKISDDEFLHKIKQLLTGEVEEEAIVDAWNALLLHFPVQRIELLKALKGRYRLFLFSNTNGIHYQKFSEMFIKAFGYPMEDLFEKSYFSHVLGQRKPEMGGFKQIIAENGLNPEETLFVDDALMNVEGAIKAGLKGLYLPSVMTIMDIHW